MRNCFMLALSRLSVQKAKCSSAPRNIQAEALSHLLCGFGISSSMSVTSGYFHNSRITAVDHARKTVPFRYKSWLDVRTKEKTFKSVTINMYEFMAKILIFLLKRHQKMIRYYGIYAHVAGERLKKITNAAWKSAIEHSFTDDPEKYMNCGTEMHPSVVYGYNAEQVWYRMRRELCLYKGFFRPIKRGP